MGFDLGDKKDCDILRQNAENYLNKWLFPFPVTVKGSAEDFIVTVRVREKCQDTVPQHGFSEEYKLRVSPGEVTIRADTVYGAIRGMETLSQLIFYDERYKKYQIRTAEIEDSPRFPVRGIMIDTSRHWLSVKVIKRQLDIMAMNKMNLLHWHMVDSEAFPYQSKKFPELHKVGAYTLRHTYSPEEVQDVINYARIRGIRVMPEFDMPGHTNGWRGREGLLSECFDEEGKPTWQDLIDVTNDTNFNFIEEFIKEIVDVFPEKFLHLGGDEVEDFVTQCWDRNPKIREFMEQKGFGNNTRLLEDYFFDKLATRLRRLIEQRTPVFWQEVFDNNEPDPKAIIHVWKGNSHEEIYERVQQITAQGYPVILSACWYLNYIKYGADWRDAILGSVPSNSGYYYCDPQNFTGSQEQKDLVYGGIAAMWGEFVDNTNIEARFWPRASAVAERLWSPQEKTQNASDAWPRMHELRCRLVARGFRIQPTNYPDYCPYEFDEKAI
ncbi:hypothetical protein WR25_14333 [Diploscapter pachys]|uniref:Beta-hexosaminidase n=1 Tax=Diploscapter pachys TaxID=2018661 RepID=A0A2A2KHB7_9BILA|nr:hypothetical protein WR25_14333 [Diploscapter pachys]